MLNFWLSNIAFIVYVFCAFALFAVAWLHWDTKAIERNRIQLRKAGGLLLVSIGFIVRVFSVEPNVATVVSYAFMVAGLGLFAFGLYKEPILSSDLKKLLPEQPHHEKKQHKAHVVIPQIVLLFPLLPAALAAYAAYSLRKHYILGKEKEYRLLIMAFGMLAGAFLLQGLRYFGGSDVILLQQVFGLGAIAWIVEHILLLGFSVILGYWFWKFVEFRVHPELFITIASIAVALSTFTAFAYSVVLFNNAERGVLNQLEKDVRVFELAVTNLEDNAYTAARLLALNPAVSQALQKRDYQSLYKNANVYITDTRSLDAIVFTDETAQVIVNTANQSAIGQSLTNDELVLYALNKADGRVSVVTEPGILGDDLVIKAVHPVLGSEGTVVGSVQTTAVIDDAFVDKVKAQTGLEVSAYIKDRRSATTILAPNSLTRRENTQDSNAAVITNVLENGQRYAGTVNVINEAYHGAYVPLRNTNREIIGMLFVGRPTTVLLNDVSTSLQITFLASLLASALSLLPAYYLAKRIEHGGV